MVLLVRIDGRALSGTRDALFHTSCKGFQNMNLGVSLTTGLSMATTSQKAMIITVHDTPDNYM
jgi:hypothetical protein